MAALWRWDFRIFENKKIYVDADEDAGDWGISKLQAYKIIL